MLSIVQIKFIAPRSEDTPAKCKLEIARATDGPGGPDIEDSGGYTVQPVPAPTSINDDKTKSIRLGGNSQKLILFKRGKAMSGAPSISGTNQFPNPPIK